MKFRRSRCGMRFCRQVSMSTLRLPPGTPNRLCLLRCSVSAAHSFDDIDKIIDVFGKVVKGLITSARTFASSSFGNRTMDAQEWVAAVPVCDFNINAGMALDFPCRIVRPALEGEGCLQQSHDRNSLPCQRRVDHDVCDGCDWRRDAWRWFRNDPVCISTINGARRSFRAQFCA